MHTRLPIIDVFALVVALVATLAHGVRTLVDDSDLAQWTYTGEWAGVTPTSPCSLCSPEINHTMSFNRTFHDTVFPAKAQLTFTGTEIEVYAICPTAYNNSFYGTNYTFTLDLLDDGTFRGPQPYCPQAVFNYLVYARKNLTRKSHSFVIANSPIPGLGYSASKLLLDYAIYDDGIDPPNNNNSSIAASSSHKKQVAMIAVAAVLGPLLVVFIGVTIWLFVWRVPRNPTDSVDDDGHVAVVSVTSPTSLHNTAHNSSYRESHLDAPLITFPIVQPAPGQAWQPTSLLRDGYRGDTVSSSQPHVPGQHKLQALSPPPQYILSGSDTLQAPSGTDVAGGLYQTSATATSTSGPPPFSR